MTTLQKCVIAVGALALAGSACWVPFSNCAHNSIIWLTPMPIESCQIVHAPLWQLRSQVLSVDWCRWSVAWTDILALCALAMLTSVARTRAPERNKEFGLLG